LATLNCQSFKLIASTSVNSFVDVVSGQFASVFSPFRFRFHSLAYSDFICFDSTGCSGPFVSHDHGSFFAQIPERWDLGYLFCLATVLGSVGCLASLLLLAMALDSNRQGQGENEGVIHANED
jgi:hypothetical protein